MTTLVDITITAPNEEWLALHAKDLIEARLAACGNIIPAIRSLYRWDGSVHDDSEAYLTLHTQAKHVDAIIDITNKAHPYETVHILATEISHADPDYRQWVIDETEPTT